MPIQCPNCKKEYPVKSKDWNIIRNYHSTDIHLTCNACDTRTEIGGKDNCYQYMTKDKNGCY